MAIAAQSNQQDGIERHSFTLILSAFEEITDEIETALFEAGCNDALLGIHAGSPYLAFDREAKSLELAIRSAIKSVEGCSPKIEVVRVVPPGADTIEVINAYLKLRKELRTQSNMPPELLRKIDECMSAIAEKRE